MNDVVQVRIYGLAELERRMIQLGPKIARKALRSALNAGAQIIKKDAQARAPFLTGRLSRRALYVARLRSASGPSEETYIIGVRHGRKDKKRDRDAYYWKFIEFGTKFMAAMPFLRPAFESKKLEVLERIKQKLRERIEVLANERP